jgi:hypothetical protein
MGVPASEVGYTIAITRRETTKVHKNIWWHWGEEKDYSLYFRPYDMISVLLVSRALSICRFNCPVKITPPNCTLGVPRSGSPSQAENEDSEVV